MGGGDWGMGGEKRTYGTYGEVGIGKGENIWNANKEYRKKIPKTKKLIKFPIQGNYLQGAFSKRN